MPSFTGKTFASFYKNILGINQSSNTGVDTTARHIQDGAGNNTSIQLSDDNLSVQPQNDDTTGTMLVKNKAGSNIFAVDTTNSKLLGGASQTALNTNYAHFGIDASAGSGTWTADNHFAVPFGLSETGATFIAMGSSTSSSFNDTDPASTLTIADNASFYINTYWYIMDNITIDAVRWWHAADAATGDSTAAHLMSYAANIFTTTGGDLTDGTVVADSATITNAGWEQAYYNQMTIRSADVSQARVVLFTFASDTVNSDYSINATVKYHIR